MTGPRSVTASCRPSTAVRRLGALVRDAPTSDTAGEASTGDIAQVADRFGLGPHLWAAGLRHGWWTELPDDVCDAVRGHLRHGVAQPELALQDAWDDNARRMADMLEQGETIAAAFAGAGVPFVRLKGWHTTSAGWWRSPVERTMTDLDVLVPGDKVSTASATLERLGYVPIASGHTARADHELPPVARAGRAGSVEIHRELLLHRWQPLLPAHDVLAAGSPMSTETALVHLVAHAQLHDDASLLGRLPLRAIREFAMAIEAAADGRLDPIDWEQVARPFRDHGHRLALATHATLASELFGTPIPPDTVPTPTVRRAARAGCRRVLWGLDHPRQAAAIERLVYLPRALGPDRMRFEYGDGAYPVLLSRHLAQRLPRHGP